MARRPGSGLVALLTALAVAACTTSGTDDSSTTGPTSATSATAATTSTSSPATTMSTTTTTTTTPAPATTGEPTTSGSPATTIPGDVDAEISIPEGEGPFPSVVLVHGGGWVTGGPQLMEPLADFLTDLGYLTVNTRYRLADLDHPGYPQAVEDVACAVRFAASHPASDGTVALVGHSSGAHIGAIVSLTGDDYRGECDIDGSGVPERFVGLAGPYDVSRLGLVVVAFFGGGPERLPDAWAAGNPQLLTDENPDLDSLIMYGDRDGIVPESFAIDFHEALTASGSESLLEKVEGARHNDMHDPDLVGDLIATWLARP